MSRLRLVSAVLCALAALLCLDAVPLRAATTLNPPSGLSVAFAPDGKSATLTWTDTNLTPTNETQTKIERRTLPSGSFTQLDSVAADVTRYVDGTTASGTRYAYRVRANRGGMLTLTWVDTANDFTGFKVERKTGTGGTYAVLAPVGMVFSYANSGLTVGTAYCYQVKATNEAGDSPPSNEACATVAETDSAYSTEAVGPAPNAPGALTVQ